MTHAERCPVCYGSGKLTDRPAVSTSDNMKTCHGCNGRGWVTVGIDYPESKDKIKEIKDNTVWRLTSSYTAIDPEYLKDFGCDAGELMDVNEVVNIYLDDDDQTKGTVGYPKKKAYIKKIGHVQLD